MLGLFCFKIPNPNLDKPDGDQMEGALKLEDGTVYRRIYLKKEGSGAGHERCARVFVR
jgi:hypothetical protein